MSIFLARRGAAAHRPEGAPPLTVPTVVGTASNSRSGGGSVSVTPPAGAASWLAFVFDNGATPNIAPATGFAQVAVLGPYEITVFKATTAPGSSWGINGTGGVTGGVVIVVGYDADVAVGASGTTASSATSPSVTLAEPSLVVRLLDGVRDSDVAPGYPAGSTLGRVSQNQQLSGFVLQLAVAHDAHLSGGTSGTAAFTAGSGTFYDSTAHTLALTTTPPA